MEGAACAWLPVEVSDMSPLSESAERLEGASSTTEEVISHSRFRRCTVRIVAAGVAALIATWALYGASGLSTGMGSILGVNTPEATAWQLKGEAQLDNDRVHLAVVENLLRVAGGDPLTGDERIVTQAVAKGFKAAGERLWRQAPKAAAALGRIRLSREEQEALLIAFRLTSDSGVQALGMESEHLASRRRSESYDHRNPYYRPASTAVLSLSDKVSALRGQLPALLGGPLHAASAETKASLRDVPVPDDAIHSRLEHSNATHPDGGPLLDSQMGTLVVRRRLKEAWRFAAPARDMRKPTPLPPHSIARSIAPPRDMRQPTPIPDLDQLQGSLAPMRDMRQPAALRLAEQQLLPLVATRRDMRESTSIPLSGQPHQPVAPARDMREPTPLPSTARREDHQSLSRAAFLAPRRDMREPTITPPSDTTPKSVALPTLSPHPAVRSKKPLLSSPVAFAAPQRDMREPTPIPHPGKDEAALELSSDMKDAIEEQARAYLGIVQALSSWSPGLGLGIESPPTVCSFDEEETRDILKAHRLFCPLHFGSVGLSILLDSSTGIAAE